MTDGERLELESTRHLAKALDLPFVDLDEYAISPGILRRVTALTTIHHRCVPVVYNRRRVVLVVDDPARVAWIVAHRREIGLPVDCALEFALTTVEGMNRTIGKRLLLRG